MLLSLVCLIAIHDIFRGLPILKAAAMPTIPLFKITRIGFLPRNRLLANDLSAFIGGA
ncbi:MAG: hypothetical protein M3Y03_02720 [Verrucomicrobiota bacterium]|nr:hypothetical protein [Verrucomicrobiota bacterium]